MLLLKLSARDLLALNERRRMVPHLAARWKHFRGSEVSEGESSAWAESLVTLAEDLMAAGRGNVEMVVECAATTEEDDRPGGPRLIDVVLVGRHPGNGRISVQLVELKRWSTVTRVEEATAELVRVPGMGEDKEEKKHPVVQLREYYHLFIGDKGPLNGLSFECGGFAYLHNASDESVKPLFDITVPPGAYSRTYTKDGREQLLRDMRRYFAEDGGASEAEILLQQMNLRNTPLLDAMINSRGEDTVFTLRGEQRDVVEDAIKFASQVLDPPEQAALVDNPERAVFLVTGGAGTGKSAIGLELKARFEAEGRSVKYASGSRAFNSAMQEHVGYGDREFKESFAYFSGFVTPPEPPLDVLICDEAHRIRARSTNRFWPQEKWGKKPQVDELLDASRLTVFFLDEGQSLRPDEVGTAKLIEDAAERYGAMLRRYHLREQFRCGGSDAYLSWVHGLLGLSGQRPREWVPDGLMHVETVDTPEEMERIIRAEAAAGASARMVAGFCWPWNEPQGDELRLEPDVHIGDWRRPWNAKEEKYCEGGTVPPSAIWSVHPNGIGQIGCVYTAQGLEWDWCGVIMGDDMVRRGDRWVFQRGRARKDETGLRRVVVPGSQDPKVNTASLDDDEFERCVRHAYHVLLTRASRATVLYSTDEETRAYLKKLVGEVRLDGLRPTWGNLPIEARVPHQRRPKRSGGNRTSGKKGKKSRGRQGKLF
ncbi:DUF2075 domain-containing protein [Streptomyces taklimakanensis]|nr:DUF2075 domain-containing protein [Streptomyces taklimakanensis]